MKRVLLLILYLSVLIPVTGTARAELSSTLDLTRLYKSSEPTRFTVLVELAGLQSATHVYAQVGTYADADEEKARITGTPLHSTAGREFLTSQGHRFVDCASVQKERWRSAVAIYQQDGFKKTGGKGPGEVIAVLRLHPGVTRKLATEVARE